MFNYTVQEEILIVYALVAIPTFTVYLSRSANKNPLLATSAESDERKADRDTRSYLYT